MINMLMGLFGALLGVLLFAVGLIIGWQIASARTEKEVPPEVMPEPEMTEDEKVRIAEEQERLRQEQAAFHDLLGYNADVAYKVRTPARKE